jgi:dipeptidyl aminopeptidase/acylaminoacyl peptidase
MARQIAPFGAWKSPITPDLIVAGSLGLGQLGTSDRYLYWNEMRPAEGGRYVVIRQALDGGAPQEMIPAGFNARTRVHEYGGISYFVAGGDVYFANYVDQRLYRAHLGEPPQPITPEENYRYTDFEQDSARQRVICVREDHTDEEHEAVNAIVALAMEGGSAGDVLVSGHDFYAFPRLSPNGRQLAWQAWNHPNMPWDGSELWLADVDDGGSLYNPRVIAGGREESIFQPVWSPDGRLFFVSDRSGWWNLYRWNGNQAEALLPRSAEFGQAQWVFGLSTYGFRSPSELVCLFSERGATRMGVLSLADGSLTEISLPFTDLRELTVTPTHALFLGSSPTEPVSVVRMDFATGACAVYRKAFAQPIDSAYVSLPEAIEFPTEHGLTAHALFYPPKNPDFEAPAGVRAPLLVMSHGGPTAATGSSFRPSIQYWTSRGIAVLDVNYGGSTGYGRAYRMRLNGQWGVVDVDDCCNGATFLAQAGRVDGQRMAITGGSAGGYTTLCALTFRHTFQAGASYYGLSELEVFARDTHKFESRYMDSLVGPYPALKAVYYERSPLNYLHQLAVPLILFQGLEDKIVPPNQAEMMFDAVKKRGLPVAYLPFAGEQHGFRRSENIKRSMEAELYFYSRIFGFELADPVPPVAIENLKS